ncbi:hypothetical protein [Streptomyces sp. NPDC051218]
MFADSAASTGSAESSESHAGGRAEAVVKRPMEVEEYLAELESLAKLISP